MLVGMSVPIDKHDMMWAINLGSERHSSSVGKGERDTRGAGTTAGMFDWLALHDTACQAFLLATDSAWLSCDKSSEVDFDSDAGRIFLAACEGAAVYIEIPLQRIKSSDVVVVVMRHADERVHKILGALLSAKVLELGKKTKNKVFDPSAGLPVDAVRIRRDAFVFNDAWSAKIAVHNSVVMPALRMDERSASRNPRRIDPKCLGRDEIVLNHQSLLKAIKSAGLKRFALGVERGIDSAETGALESHFLGAEGEVGLIKLNPSVFRFLSPTNTYKKMDFDNDIWLCTRGRNDWDLIVQPEDLEKPGFSKRRHVLAVQKDVKTMRYVGWITGAEIVELIASGLVKLEDPTGQGRKKAYFVKQMHIKRSMQELIELVHAEGTKAKVAL